METPTKSKRGFACMSKAQRQRIASLGGKAATERGTRYKFTSEAAAKAAKIGHERGTAHEFSSSEARAAGRKGGRVKAMRQHGVRAYPTT